MMPARPRSIATAFVLLLGLAALPSAAQQWAGKGRLQGEVTDEQNKPVAGARIILRMGNGAVDAKAEGPAALTTNKAGKWSYLGLTGGDWGVLIEKEGYIPSEGQVKVNEFGPAQPIRITLKAVSAEQQAAAAGAEASNTAAKETKDAIVKGNELLAAEKFAEARAEYEKAIDQVPDETKAALLRAIAQTWYREKQIDKAIEALDKALAVQPNDPEAHKLMANLKVAKGITFYNDNKMPEALAQFSAAAEIDPTMAEAFYYRGLANLAQGKNDAAKADLQKSLDLDPNHPNAAEARDFLKSI
jgi:tetratricopeptide (TPR) repeat protein